MEKRNKIIYWVATGLLLALVGASGIGYLFNFDAVAPVFEKLQYPTFVIVPLGITKLLAIVAILTKKSQWLKEWAYAGLFFDFALAFQAHTVANDHDWLGAVVATVLLAISYIYDKKVFGA